MLEGLDSVDWAALEHAYGVATDVPALIRDLASPDPQASEAACCALLGNIWHQGTVYPASVAAMPFLVELLASDATWDDDVRSEIRAALATLRRVVGPFASAGGSVS